MLGVDVMKPLINQTPAQLMKDIAAKYPKHNAISYRGQIWTHQELDALTDDLAAGLLASGIQKGDHIALLSENTAYAVFCFYGIIKAGAVVCMFNTSLKAQEMADLADLSDISYLMIGSEYKDTKFFPESLVLNQLHPMKKIFSLCSDLPTPYMELHELIELGRRYPHLYQEQQDHILASDDGMILYTSGTTGSSPKAVVASYFHLVNAGIQKGNCQQAAANDVICCGLQLFHIFCIDVNVLAALAVGACLAIPDDLHTASILKTLASQSCTIFSCIPSMFLALMARDDFYEWDLSHLRIGLIGGSYCSPTVFLKIEQAFGLTLLSALGQTEAIAGITVTHPDDSLEVRSTTIGHFVDHSEGKIVRPETRETLPPGQTGEICLRSRMLMKGYYNRPDLTRQAIDDDGWLHTGDLGQLDHRGNLHYIGRLKEMINRGGEKIIPAEVENAINALAEINCCKVVGLPDPHYGEEVCACIVPKPGTNIAANEIKKLLKGTIADFKIPKYIIFLEHFPMNANGKVRMQELTEIALTVLS